MSAYLFSGLVAQGELTQLLDKIYGSHGERLPASVPEKRTPAPFTKVELYKSRKHYDS